jgi:phosphopantothenoylcysteine decarboxylase/phosphopantothenate--cysteine ligase
MIVAPAMDKNMSDSDIVQKNMKSVKKFANVIEPVMIEGKAKLPSKERLVAEACKMAGPKSLNRKKVLIIGGGSSEPIDDVRVISNRSSGRMAISLAESAFAMGADVDLWLGNASYECGNWIKTTRFEALSKLRSLVKGMKRYDAIVVPAALSDFIPERAKGKLDSAKQITLKMKKTPKIINGIRKKHKGLLYVFKLGARISEKELLAKAKVLLKNANCVIANHSKSMGSDKSKVAIVDKKNIEWISGSKVEISNKILDKIASELN